MTSYVSRALLGALSATLLARPAVAQDAHRPADVSALLTVTNKGMSTIPAFTLGKPAALLFMYIRKGPFSVDPEYRSELTGKPWAVLLWGRYRIQRDRLLLMISAHPAINFRPTTMNVNGADREIIVARRYVVGELAPTYSLTQHASVGATYLYLRGIETDVARHTHFVSLRSVLGVPLPAGYSMRILPQTYYLNMGRRTGYYVYSSVTLARRGIPLSVSTAANDPIRTSIATGKEFTWNVAAHYTIQ